MITLEFLSLFKTTSFSSIKKKTFRNSFFYYSYLKHSTVLPVMPLHFIFYFFKGEQCLALLSQVLE